MINSLHGRPGTLAIEQRGLAEASLPHEIYQFAEVCRGLATEHRLQQLNAKIDLPTITRPRRSSHGRRIKDDIGDTDDVVRNLILLYPRL